jgi:hypothetical protein
MKYKYESERSQNTYLFWGTSFAILFGKSDKYKTTICWIIENGLTMKINPNTNIFNSVINAVQTFKDLFAWRHNVAPNIACKTSKNNITARCKIAAA